MIALGVMGFVVKIASMYQPSLSVTACVLLGMGSVGCWMNPLFGSILITKNYPSRFVAPGIIGIALITVLIHALLLNTFRNRILLLDLVYLVIAVAMVILYFMLEPYLFHSFKNHPLTENADFQPGKQLTENPNRQPSELPSNLQAATIDYLSFQELRIVELSLQGYTYAEIAQALKLKLNTIKWYMKNIYSKLQINSKAELFNLAHRKRMENE